MPALSLPLSWAFEVSKPSQYLQAAHSPGDSMKLEGFEQLKVQSSRHMGSLVFYKTVQISRISTKIVDKG
jgi:hypothetical protein